MSRKLLLLPGMTPGGRVFRKLLPHLHDYKAIDWIDPQGTVSISEYAQKLADEAKIDSTYDVLGISFGGIVAQEIAPLIGSKQCFLVSSIGSRAELSPMIRALSHMPASLHNQVTKLVGNIAHSWPLKSSAATIRVRKFTSENGAWFRWATAAAIKWKPSRNFHELATIRIHGDRDKTFPQGHKFANHVIEGADHLLAISHANPLVQILANYRTQ